MNIETQTKLLRLKSLLNKISDASYAYGMLSKRHPIEALDDEQQGKELMKAYQSIIDDLKSYFLNHEQRTELHRNQS